MEDDFDEFGNFIGNEYSESDPEVENEDSDETNVQHITPQYATQSINEPLVRRRGVSELETIEPNNWLYHRNILKNIPSLIKNVAIVGHLGHGKSTLCNWLSGCNNNTPTTRGISQQTSLFSLLMSDLEHKSYALNLADTPGHPDFENELLLSLELCDGVCLVVDIVEGLLPTSYRFRSKPVKLIILNKLDRFILELRLSPDAAAERIKLVWDQCKAEFPDSTIIFASTKYEFSFSLHSINKLYMKYQGVHTLPLSEIGIDVGSFATYALHPLFKLFSCALIGETTSGMLLHSSGIKLQQAQWQGGFEMRIQVILEKYFEDTSGVISDALIKCGSEKRTLIPSAVVKSVNISGQDFSLCTGPIEGIIYIPIGKSLAQTDAIGECAWGLIPNSGLLPSNKLILNYPEPVLSVAVEPFPDTTKNLEALKSSLENIRDFHPGLKFTQAVSGEYNILGYGELYFDTMLNELRSTMSCELRVSQPLPIFQETVQCESSIAIPAKCGSEFVVVVIARPRAVNHKKDESKTNLLYADKYCELNSLTSISIDSSTKSYLIEGFKWCCQRGPLAEGKLTNVAFTISELEILSNATVQVAALMERACHAAFLMASPRLMEPYMEVYTVGKALIGKALYREMEKRGGLICTDSPIYMTNLYYTSGDIAAIDHFGLEIDVLTQLESRNTGRIVSFFGGSYRLVSGNPLDSDLPMFRLRAAPEHARARDYMLKLRKRRGLSKAPELEHYLDEDVKELLF